ncbi:MAG TPA: diacylglycerol kinase family protein [Pyrinomonadaceae bacterium]|jgi:diacylglycerol kinase family enzyme
MQQASERVLVLVNKAASRASRAWPLIKAVLEEHEVSFEGEETGEPGGMERRVRAALREGCRTVAVVGGDGTLSEAARGFFESPAELKDGEFPSRIETGAALAILPAGTGDDFARGLKGSRASLEECLERLVKHCRALRGEGHGAAAETLKEAQPEREGAAQQQDSEQQKDWEQPTTRLVDTLYASTDGGAHRFVCLNAATLGIGAEVAARVAAQKGAVRRLSGEARFALAAAGALLAWRNREVRVRIDDEHLLECATNLVAVTNGAYAGGGMRFAPSARPDDGRLEVVTGCRISRAGIVRELARIHRGGHLANAKVILKTGTRVRIEMAEPSERLPVEADGDLRGHTPAEFQLMPRSLRLVW